MSRANPARRAKSALKRAARAAGLDLVAHNFYSPIPDWEQVPAGTFERRGPLRGIDFDLESHLAFLGELEPFLAEFEPPPRFVWGNGMYDTVEADVLYAIVRRHRPNRIIELGSGYSSLLIASAVQRNAAEGHHAQYTAHDPHPSDLVRAGVDHLDLRAESATEVALDEFATLRAGDVLFVDTTHTVKLGSEVNYVILDVLPTIVPGVLVHVHDVFLPYEYPLDFFEKDLYWSEQYLLQAFLAQNPAWEVVLPLNALVRERRADVAALVRSVNARSGPGAFWIRSVER